MPATCENSLLIASVFVTGSSPAKIKDEKGDAGGFEERRENTKVM